LEDVFKRTRAAVRAESEGKQVPWENTSLEGDFFFNRAPADFHGPAAANVAAPPEPARPKSTQAAAVDAPPAPVAPPRLKSPQAAAVDSPAAAQSRPAQPALAATDRAMRSDGQDQLIVAYRRGDYPLAYRLALPLGERGQALAQLYLGEMYRLGHGVNASYPDAIQWYRRAADQGMVPAQEWLGKIYVAGLGISRDYPEALKWFRRAADQGSSSAQNELGKMFRNGLGAPRSDADALHWFEMAAGAGNPEAQYNLQLLQTAGRGE
jgi:TPR repeat protein